MKVIKVHEGNTLGNSVKAKAVCSVIGGSSRGWAVRPLEKVLRSGSHPQIHLLMVGPAHLWLEQLQLLDLVTCSAKGWGHPRVVGKETSGKEQECKQGELQGTPRAGMQAPTLR